MKKVSMRWNVRTVAIAAFLMAGAALPAHAQGTAAAPVVLTLQGRLAHPRSLDLTDLQAMPAVTVEVSHTGHDGVQTSRYTGVLLWSLLSAAEPVDGNGPRTHLQHVIRATGQDGYSVALAIGEIEPGFEGKQVLVAYAENGRVTPTLKLVVPADAKAGRSVRDLVSIDLD